MFTHSTYTQPLRALSSLPTPLSSHRARHSLITLTPHTQQPRDSLPLLITHLLPPPQRKKKLPLTSRGVDIRLIRDRAGAGYLRERAASTTTTGANFIWRVRRFPRVHSLSFPLRPLGFSLMRMGAAASY